jgi:hypothetical protein
MCLCGGGQHYDPLGEQIDELPLTELLYDVGSLGVEGVLSLHEGTSPFDETGERGGVEHLVH